MSMTLKKMKFFLNGDFDRSDTYYRKVKIADHRGYKTKLATDYNQDLYQK